MWYENNVQVLMEKNLLSLRLFSLTILLVFHKPLENQDMRYENNGQALVEKKLLSLRLFSLNHAVGKQICPR